MTQHSRTIVITGVTRGLGRALSLKLAALGHQVIGCGRSESALQSLRTESGDTLALTQVDIVSAEEVQTWATTALKAFGPPDLLINNAGIMNPDAVFVRVSAAAFNHMIDVNIKGTANILQAALMRGVQKVLHTSTSEVYGTAQYVPIDEKHTRQGQSPYSATKIGADAIADSFYRSFGLPVVTVRPFNTYGPRQSARAVIPTILTQILSEADEIKLGALHPTRDLVYVQDTVEGFIKLSQSAEAVGQDVNIATQTEVSIGEIAQLLMNQLDVQRSIIQDDARLRPPKSEVERLLGSNARLIQSTGWSPQYTIERGLQETVAWFKNKEHIRAYKPERYNV